jgi:predicted DNA-binding protein (UPF0251 family)
MPRPCCRRRLGWSPSAGRFAPAGDLSQACAEVLMGLDEIEAVRLADLEGLYHEQAAGRMGVSRPTFSRILRTARRKVAEALVNGWALRFHGGPVEPSGGAVSSGDAGSARDEHCGCPAGGRRRCASGIIDERAEMSGGGAESEGSGSGQ